MTVDKLTQILYEITLDFQKRHDIDQLPETFDECCPEQKHALHEIASGLLNRLHIVCERKYPKKQ